VLYSKNRRFQSGNFRIKEDTVDVYPSYADEAYKFISLVMKLRRSKAKDSKFLKN
jgi:excinuclease ABC subunit B